MKKGEKLPLNQAKIGGWQGYPWILRFFVNGGLSTFFFAILSQYGVNTLTVVTNAGVIQKKRSLKRSHRMLHQRRRMRRLHRSRRWRRRRRWRGVCWRGRFGIGRALFLFGMSLRRCSTKTGSVTVTKALIKGVARDDTQRSSSSELE